MFANLPFVTGIFKSPNEFRLGTLALASALPAPAPLAFAPTPTPPEPSAPPAVALPNDALCLSSE